MGQSKTKRAAGIEIAIHYLFEGAYHEAGHAIMYAYLKVPFHSVTIATNKEGGTAGLVREVPNGAPARMVNVRLDAIISAAGPAATDLYDEFHPDYPLKRWEESDRQDREHVQHLGTKFEFPHPDHLWTFMLGEASDNLRIPYVWAAVEELAQALLRSGGEHEIPAKAVRLILRNAKRRLQGGR